MAGDTPNAATARQNTSTATASVCSVHSVASASSAGAHGAPLMSAIPSFTPSSISPGTSSNSQPSARISPGPPLPSRGTGGSSRPSSRRATASTSAGVTPACPSMRLASRASTKPRTTRRGNGAPNEVALCRPRA